MHLFLKGKVPFLHCYIVPKYFVTKYFWHNFDGRWNIHQWQSAQKMWKRVQKYRLACLPKYTYIPPKNWISTLFLHSARRGIPLNKYHKNFLTNWTFLYSTMRILWIDGWFYVLAPHNHICTSKTLLTIMSLSLAKLY